MSAGREGVVDEGGLVAGVESGVGLSVAGGAQGTPVEGGVCEFARGPSTPSVMAFWLGSGCGVRAWLGAGARQALAVVSGTLAARAAS